METYTQDESRGSWQRQGWFKILLVSGSLMMGVSASNVYADGVKENWTNWGQNLNNTSNNPDSGISKSEVSTLVELCKIDYTAHANSLNPATQSTSSKPIIIDNVVYWSAFSGQVGAATINRDKNGNILGCSEKWVTDVSDALGITENGGPVLTSEPASRVSPAYYVRDNGKGALLYTGVSNSFTLPFSLWFSTPPMAFALDAEDGTLLWKVDLAAPGGVNPDAFFPALTSSPRIHNNVAYFGISSLNNALGGVPITFRGHMVALDLGTSATLPHVKWTQFTVPPKPASYPFGTWFAGGGVWGSSPSIIPEQNLVIFGSGQLYQYPDFVTNCMATPEAVNDGDVVTTLRGETGKGAAQCFKEAEQTLKTMGINEPLATNSVIALNMNDGSFKWVVPTAGIDSWQAQCGIDINIPCNVPVAGPDWDISGNAPLVIREKLDGKAVKAGSGTLVVSHNKGGSIFWIDAADGKLLRTADVCVGSAMGGIHWGLSYDPSSKLLLASCSGGQKSPVFGNAKYNTRTANGLEFCAAGYLNAIDVRTAELKWQAIPPAAERATGVNCPVGSYQPDLKFKYGLSYDVVIKNQLANVPVNEMPHSASIPLTGQEKAFSNGLPVNSKGVVYWPVYYGTVYALDMKDGSYLNQFHCDQGPTYMGGAVANGMLAFGCGYGFIGGPADNGKHIMVFGMPKTSKDK